MIYAESGERCVARVYAEGGGVHGNIIKRGAREVAPYDLYDQPSFSAGDNSFASLCVRGGGAAMP